MRALVITGRNELSVQQVPKPTLRPFDVLVRVHYVGICGTDIEILRGEGVLFESGAFRYPTRIGHEWSGIVEEVGSQVQDLKPGDRVISDSGVSCGECPACLAGNYRACSNHRAIGTRYPCWPGAFADYMCLPHWHVHRIPDHVGLEEAALVEPTTIAQRGMREGLASKSVLVTGTGPIGLAAVGLAKCYGSPLVMVAGRREEKLAIARELGADLCINMGKESISERVLEATDGKGADFLVEASGATVCLKEALPAMGRCSLMRLLSFCGTSLDTFDIDSVVNKSISMIGGSSDGKGGVITPSSQEVLDFVEAGKLKLKPLITHVFPLDEAPEVFLHMDDYQSERVKILIDCQA